MNGFSFPLLHAAGAVYPTGWLHSNWHLEPPVLAGAIALAALYVIWTGVKNRDASGALINPVSGRERAYFLFGLVILIVSLNPPLDDLSDYYLLSAHMLEHMLLIFVVVPLLLLGTPGWLIAKILAPRRLAQVWEALTKPIPAAILSSALLIGWHFPFAFDAAIRNQPIHVAEHVSFLLAALLSWWPVMGPLMPNQTRMSPPLQCLYLFALSIPSGILGAFITLGGPTLYTSYVHAPEIWGISRSTDQEIAGTMMWVIGGMIYFVILTAIFFSWASREEAKENAPVVRPGPPARGATRSP